MEIVFFLSNFHRNCSLHHLSYYLYYPAVAIRDGTIIVFFHSSSAGASSPVRAANAASIDWLGSSAQASKVGAHSSRTSLSTNAAGGSSALELSHLSCRPWERGDLLRRLASFKPSTWFSRPKVLSFFFTFVCDVLFFVLILPLSTFFLIFTFWHLVDGFVTRILCIVGFRHQYLTKHPVGYLFAPACF
jgi:hypothetical protein